MLQSNIAIAMNIEIDTFIFRPLTIKSPSLTHAEHLLKNFQIGKTRHDPTPRVNPIPAKVLQEYKSTLPAATQLRSPEANLSNHINGDSTDDYTL
jgi:hypothetical protein